MADSPLLDSDGALRVTIRINNTPLDEAVPLISVTVERAVNKVPSARMVFVDGDMSSGKFPLSDEPTLIPGAAIKISAGDGDGDGEETIFEGVVVKHAIHIGEGGESRLIVDCRDKAVKMTVGRRSGSYRNQRDSDVIASLIRNVGLSADVQETRVECTDLVQYCASDWDFMLSRAEANGMLVIASDGKVVVQRPDTSSKPALMVTYGTDLLSFDAEIDARAQFASVDAFAWDPKVQAQTSASALPEALNRQGNLDSKTLIQAMGSDSFRLQAGVPMSKPVLQQWADAQQLKSGLARMRGRMRFQGSAKARVGGLIELANVGQRFNGQVFVGGLRHEISEGHWITEVEFGLPPAWHTEQPGVMAPAASGLLPGIEGLQIGKVLRLDADPDGQHRVQVTVPVLGEGAQPVWARLMQWHASSGFGAFFVPEKDDEVVLGFFNNDPTHPVILGSLYSSGRVPPYQLEQDNSAKAIVTRSKLKLEFDEKNKVITVTTEAGNRVVLSDQDQSILLLDQNRNRVELTPGGITIDTPKDLKLKAKGSITLDAKGGVAIAAEADVKVRGMIVSCEAEASFVGKGAASAELSAAGQTTVRGTVVMIN